MLNYIQNNNNNNNLINNNNILINNNNNVMNNNNNNFIDTNWEKLNIDFDNSNINNLPPMEGFVIVQLKDFNSNILFN